MNWLKRLLAGGRERRLVLPEAPAPAPPWAVELQETVQRVGRAQTRVIARIEALESKLEGGFSDLRSNPNPRPADIPSFDEVLDALDILAEACRSLDSAGNAPAAHGLRGVVDRLERFLGRMGLTRLAEPPVMLDGRLFRVVGVVERPDLADGAAAQVVRAAAVAGEQVLREGEVLINRRP